MNNKIRKTTLYLMPTAMLLLVFLIIILLPEKAHAEKLYEVLNPSCTDKAKCGPSITVREVWGQIRNLINYLVIAVLIYVAFLNILRIQMNNYAIKKFLPALIMGVILANFSFLICRLLVDLANVAMDMLINSPNGVNAIGDGKNFGIAGSFALQIKPELLAPKGVLDYGYTFTVFIFNLLEFAGSIIVLILAFLFFIRNYVIYFLVALSPLAFMVTGIPMAKSVWNQWWTNFTKWTFMPIVSLFWLWIGGMWLEPFRTLATQGSAPGWFLGILFAGVCFYLAITTPFKMGGAIMSGWNKTTQKGGKWGLGQVSGAGARMSFAGQNLAARNPKGSFRARLGGVLDKTGGVVNVNGNLDAWKKRRASAVTNLQKATVKTGTYQRIGGKETLIEGMRAKHEDEIKNMPVGVAGEKMGPIEDNFLREAMTGTGRIARKLREDLASKVRGGDFRAATVGEDERRAAIRRLLSTDGVSKSLLKYQGMAGLGNADEAVMTEGVVRNFQKFAKGSARNRTDLFNAYSTYGVPAGAGPRPAIFASSAVGTPASGAVGTPAQGGQAPSGPIPKTDTREHSEAIRNLVASDQGEELVQAAHHGSEAFDAAASSAGVDMSKLTPGAQQALRTSFGEIRTTRDTMIADMVKEGADQIDEEMVGARMAFNNVGSSRNAGNVSTRLGLLDNQVGVGLAHLQSGNTDEAVKIAQKFGIAVQAHDKDVESRLEQTFRQMRSGVQDLKSMGAGAIPLDNRAFETQLRTAKAQALKQEAESTVSSQFVVRQTPIPQSLASVPAEQIHDNQEALGQLTSHFNEMMAQVSRTQGVAQTPRTTPESASSFFKELSGGSAPGATVGSVLADPRAMDLLAQKIGRATVQAQKRSGIGDIRAPRVQPSGNVTNNVTQVIQNGPSTGSGVPRPPSAGAGTTIPPSRPE